MVGTADHHGIVVSDIDRALTFYRDTLGMEVVEEISQESDAFSRAVGVENTDVDLAFLDAHGFTIELVQYNRPVGGNVNETAATNDVGAAHFCLAVDDIEGVYDELRDDVEFVNPPQELENGVKLAFMRDPDGNVVELLQD
jgi:catechol 2,3-dioxygenase-like lactoylglutathione lyase family enzyme